MSGIAISRQLSAEDAEGPQGQPSLAAASGTWPTGELIFRIVGLAKCSRVKPKLHPLELNEAGISDRTRDRARSRLVLKGFLALPKNEGSIWYWRRAA
jgi:hypothetical protein